MLKSQENIHFCSLANNLLQMFFPWFSQRKRSRVRVHSVHWGDSRSASKIQSTSNIDWFESNIMIQRYGDSTGDSIIIINHNQAQSLSQSHNQNHIESSYIAISLQSKVLEKQATSTGQYQTKCTDVLSTFPLRLLWGEEGTTEYHWVTGELLVDTF